jgi:hypothetical protein
MTINRRFILYGAIPIIVLFGFIIFITWNYLNRGLFEYIGIDFRLWYSSGWIAREYGFSHIYDQSLQSYYQSQLFNSFSISSKWSMSYWPLPLPYLSVFVLPMLVLTIFKPVQGFLIWTCINTIGTIIYVWLFQRRMGRPSLNRVFLPVIISLPVLLNLLFGQINLLLLIAFGESLIRIREERWLEAGLWLGLLMLKPQTLLLIIPFLLISRNYRIIFGTLISSFGLILISFLLSGKQAFLGPYQVITSWPKILADSSTNILSLVANVSKYLPDYISTLITFVSFLTTFYFVQRYFSAQQWKLHLDHVEVDYLVLFNATCLISPHANIHMLLPQVILLLSAYQKRFLTSSCLLIWGIFPLLIFLISSIDSIGIAHNIAAVIQILLCLCLLYELSLVNAKTKLE